MKRAACYLRVSTDTQTIENQRAPLEAMCKLRGWEPSFYEETESAAKRRPIFERMLADAHEGKVCAVVVVALDRLGRSLVGVLQTVMALDKLKVRVVSMREPWLEMDGPARELLVSIFAWVAQQERAVLIDRTKAGLRRARAEGKTLGRPRASTVLVGAAVDRVVNDRATVRVAAYAAGVSERTLRRALQACGATPGRRRGMWLPPAAAGTGQKGAPS